MDNSPIHAILKIHQVFNGERKQQFDYKISKVQELVAIPLYC